MGLEKQYAIKPDTMAILPQHDEFGYLHTLMCHRQGTTVADMSPFELIERNLQYLGSSIHGATLSSKALIGASHRYPLVINEELDIILMPCVSPKRHDCIWFSIRHIRKTEKYGADETLVHMSNGGTIIANISKLGFDTRLKKAYELRYKTLTRKREFVALINEPSEVYHLKKDGNRLNFELSPSEESKRIF